MLATSVRSMWKGTSPDGSHYYVQIMLPGFITGAIIGFLTQRMGTSPKGSHYAKTNSL